LVTAYVRDPGCYFIGTADSAMHSLDDGWGSVRNHQTPRTSSSSDSNTSLQMIVSCIIFSKCLPGLSSPISYQFASLGFLLVAGTLPRIAIVAFGQADQNACIVSVLIRSAYSRYSVAYCNRQKIHAEDHPRPFAIA